MRKLFLAIITMWISSLEVQDSEMPSIDCKCKYMYMYMHLYAQSRVYNVHNTHFVFYHLCDNISCMNVNGNESTNDVTNEFRKWATDQLCKLVQIL